MSAGIVGLVVLAVACAMAYFAWRSSRRVAAITATETTSCAAVKAALAGGSEQVVELVGRAATGADGLVTAPFTRTRCVWYRSVLKRKYWDWHSYQDSKGQSRRRRVERTEVVLDTSSSEPFTLRDNSGQVIVDPSDARIDNPRQVMNRFGRETGSLLMDLGLQAFSQGNTMGFRREEWVIEPNERLYVLGAAVATGDEATIVKPRSGHRELLISTRSERQLVRGGRWRTRLLYAGVVVAAVGGTALIVFDLAG